jgi:antitoxin YefM
MQIINFSEARNNLKGIIDRVVEDADYTVIARRDAPNAVIVSQEYFDAMMETVHLLKVPANTAHLQKSIAQYRQGKVKVRKLVDIA